MINGKVEEDIAKAPGKLGIVRSFYMINGKVEEDIAEAQENLES